MPEGGESVGSMEVEIFCAVYGVIDRPSNGEFC